jgi:hypothetical protein
MNTLAQTPGLMLYVALALTALLATESTTDPLWLLDQAHADRAKTSWLPWLVLIGLGFTSGIVAVLHPLPFAAAFGQELS